MAQPYDIRYGALLPLGVENLLTAGRCISGSREAMASYRVTGNCAQMGENAGYYIAKAIRDRVDIRDVRLNLVLTNDEIQD